MKRIVLIFCLVLGLTACVHTLDETPGAEVSTSLALSIKNAGGGNPRTKMTQSITQQEGSSFRGIEKVYIIPFNTTNGSPVTPGMSREGDATIQYPGFTTLVENNNAHLINMSILPHHMNRALVYGKAIDSSVGASTKEQKHANGVLNPVGLTTPAGSDDISFQLEAILGTDEAAEVESKAGAMISALNGVMQVMLDAGDPELLRIVDTIAHENQILACSYPTFVRLQAGIYDELTQYSLIDPAVLDAINAAIPLLSAAISNAGANFPASYGIPEGALAFTWNGREFVRLVSGVHIALVAPDGFCYPPSLWYQANSPVATSSDVQVINQYNPSNDTWEDILEYYRDGGTVLTSTRSAAIVDQLQYGVGMMRLSLIAADSDSIATALGRPVTGLIVGEQREVDFSFSPKTTTANKFFAYDNVLESTGNKALSVSDSVIVTTLLLPTQADAKVCFAVEFHNNTNDTLVCHQGVILPYCKFYLAGELDINDENTVTQPAGAPLTSVISRDRITAVRARAMKLSKAYNTVPDLRDPQLEIGIVAEMKWEQITPASIKMDL